MLTWVENMNNSNKWGDYKSTPISWIFDTYIAVLAKDDFKKAQIKQTNVRHTNLLSRRHFEAVPECCAQYLPVAASVTAPLKIPAQFDELFTVPVLPGKYSVTKA